VGDGSRTVWPVVVGLRHKTCVPHAYHARSRSLCCENEAEVQIGHWRVQQPREDHAQERLCVLGGSDP
jgi:hypothetical protein